MRVALVGRDPAMVEIARAVVAAGHQIDALDHLAATTDGLEQLAAAPDPQPWQAVLEAGRSDAFVVGAVPDGGNLADPLRQLLREGIGVLAMHPLPLSPLTYYELEAIRSDTGARLHFFVPGRGHPSLAWLQEQVRAGERGELGRIELVEWQRALSERCDSSVQTSLSRDIVLLWDLCDELNRVMAWGGRGPGGVLENLQVQFNGMLECPVRWRVEPADGSGPAAAVTVVGEKRRVSLEMPATVDQWRIHPPLAAAPPAAESPLYDGASRCVQQWLGDAAGESRQADNWLQAAHAVELCDAVPRCVTRGRSVELHFEEYSPEATFKGRMAALGCGLLMLGLLAVLLVGFWGDALSLWGPDYVPPHLEAAVQEQPELGDALRGERLSRGWWLLVLLPMLAFLILQSLPKLLGAGGDSRGNSSETSRSPGSGQ